MSKFLIQFKVHIIESLRPKDEGFQKVYDINEVYDFEDDRALGPTINRRYEFLIKEPGLTVVKHDQIVDTDIASNNVVKRMFIPWHMIAYLDARYELITEPMETPLQSLVPSDEFLEEPKGTVN